ncbi:unnamed protein product, partial [Ectocarpus sp. 8 AP-2014]
MFVRQRSAPHSLGKITLYSLRKKYKEGKRHNVPYVGNDMLVVGNESSPGIRLQQAVWGVVAMTLRPPAPDSPLLRNFQQKSTETRKKSSRQFAINGPRGTTIPCGLTSLPGGPY